MDRFLFYTDLFTDSLEAVNEYLKNNGGYEYEVYNRLCPGMGEPDSNIVEYAEDVLEMINILLEDNKQRQTLFEEYYN